MVDADRVGSGQPSGAVCITGILQLMLASECSEDTARRVLAVLNNMLILQDHAGDLKDVATVQHLLVTVPLPGSAVIQNHHAAHNAP